MGETGCFQKDDMERVLWEKESGHSRESSSNSPCVRPTLVVTGNVPCTVGGSQVDRQGLDDVSTLKKNPKPASCLAFVVTERERERESALCLFSLSFLDVFLLLEKKGVSPQAPVAPPPLAQLYVDLRCTFFPRLFQWIDIFSAHFF